MAAQQRYFTSILSSFSTFLENRSANPQVRTTAMELFQDFLAEKKDFSVWTAQEISDGGFFNRQTKLQGVTPAPFFNGVNSGGIHSEDNNVDKKLPQTVDSQTIDPVLQRDDNADSANVSPITREAVSLIRDFITQHPPFQTNVFLLEYLLALKGDGCSPATVRNYRSDINQFLSFTNATAVDEALAKPKVAAFVRYQSEKGLKESSIQRKLKVINQFRLWLQTEGVLPQSAELTTEPREYLQSVTSDQKPFLLSSSRLPAQAGVQDDKVDYPSAVIPAKAGIHSEDNNADKTLPQSVDSQTMDPGLHRDNNASKNNAGIRKSKTSFPDSLFRGNDKVSEPESAIPVSRRSILPSIYFTPEEARRADARKTQEKRARFKSRINELSNRAQRQTKQLAISYLNFALIILFFLGVAIFGYQQFFTNVEQKLAYPSSLTRANRVLSFQGRLTDTAQNPITTAKNFNFKLFDAGPSTSGGTQLWDSGTCSITPDQDGIFSTGLGSGCGTEIGEDVFTANSNVWLQVTVEGETLAPRQPIRTVPYAVNAETLQGYPASPSAVENTVLVMDNSGNIVLGNANPQLIATGDSFSIEAQSLTLRTASGSDGDIVLDPDGLGEIIARSYIAAPGATLSATYAAGVPLTIKGGPSGTGNLTEWKNNSGTTLSVVDESGNLGIGTTNPIVSLDVVKDSNGLSNSLLASYGFVIRRGASDGLSIGDFNTYKAIQTWNARPLSLNPAGNNVGIGSTSPSEKLDIVGNLKLSGTTTFNNLTYTWPAAQTNGYILQTNGSGTLSWADPSVLTAASNYWNLTGEQIHPKNALVHDLLIGGTSTASAKFFAQANTGNGYFAGNVGIGTTSPSTQLHLRTTSGGVIRLDRDDAVFGTDDILGDIQFYTNDSSQTTAGIAGAIRFIGGENWNSAGRFGRLGFFTADLADNGLYPERMSILTGGNVGIGTTNPQTKLEVTGGLYLDDQSGDSPVFRLYSEDNNYLQIQKLNNNYASISTTHKDLVLQPAGNVGIGTTAPTAKLDIAYITDNSPGLILSNTTGTVGSRDPSIRLTNSDANWTFGIDDNLSDTFAIAPSNTFNITTHKVVITTAGSVGIGTTSPSDTLHVAGSLRLTGAFKDAANSAGTSGYVLSSTGTGTSWVDPVSLTEGTNYWALTGEQIHPKNALWHDLAIGGTSTASATILAEANTGYLRAQRFIDTANTNYYLDPAAAGTSLAVAGNVGIGTSSPAVALDVNGQIYISDGTAGTPAISFRDDTNTGFYRQGSDLLSFVANGQNALNIDGTSGVGRLLIGDGSPVSRFQINDDNNNAASGLTLGENASTYIQLYKAGDNQLAIMGGNVGIGTTSPGAKLDILGDLNVTGYATTSASLAVGYTNAPAGVGNAIFSGNVGIGTTSPSDTLHVAGSLRLTGALKDAANSAGSSGYVLSSTGTGTSWVDPVSLTEGTNYWALTGEQIHPKNALWHDLAIGGTSTASATILAEANTGYLRAQRFIDTANTNYFLDPAAAGTSLAVAGNVGIGTTSPVTNLHVRGYGAATQSVNSYDSTIVLDSSTTASTDVGPVLRFMGQSGNATNPYSFGWIKGAKESNTANSYAGYLSFSTVTSAGGYGERMRIASDGNVGIGTTSPGEKLHISANADTKLKIESTLTGGTGQTALTLANSVGTVAYEWLMQGMANDGRFRIFDNAGASTGERLTIDTTGNVGIGTTNPISKLQVNGAIRSDLYGDAGTLTNAAFLAWGAQDNDTSLVLGQPNVVNWRIRNTATTGTLSFATSGTGTERFNIKTNGYVGIGTTAPSTLLQLGTAGTTAGTLSLAGGTSGLVTIDTAAAAGTWSFTLPTSGGTSGYVLQTDGSGNSSWADPSVLVGAANYWALTGEQIHPKNALVHDLMIGGTSTASAKFYAQANTGNGYFAGNVGIGTSSPVAQLDISSGGMSLLLGANNFSTTRSNSTLKASRIGSYHYTNSEEPLGLILGLSDATTNTISIGGGSSSFNAATQIDFYTAANNTTTTGTSRMTILSNGNVGIGTTAPEGLLDLGNTDLRLLAKTSNVEAFGLGMSGGVGDRQLLLSSEQGGNRQALGFGDATGTSGTIFGVSWSADSGSSWNSALAVKQGGNVGIGTTAPSEKLDVVGNLKLSGTTTFNNLTYTWPAAQTAGYVLQTNGSGTLSWADPAVLTASSNYWALTGEQIHPKNALVHDLMIGGTSTASAKFFAQANTGNGYFAGNVGIGTTSPGAKLQINTGADATIGQIIRANSGTQTADLTQWQNSGSGVLKSIHSDGLLQFNTIGLVSGTMHSDVYSAKNISATNTHNYQPIRIVDNVSVATGESAGIWGSMISNTYSGAGTMSQGSGVQGSLTLAGTGTVNDAAGGQFLLSANSSATLGQVYGGKFYMAFGSSYAGSVSTQATAGNFVFDVQSGSAGTIGTGYVGRFTASKSGGSTTNISTLYGLYVDNVNQASNNYALYTGLGNVSFGDDVLLRNDSDHLKLGASGDLDLYHDGTNSYITNNTGDLYIGDAGTDDVILSNNGGRVGIGTTNPTAKLSFGSSSGTSGTKTLALYESGSSWYGLGIQSGTLQVYSSADSDSNKIAFGKYNGTTFTENVTFLSGGNVGIGTTSPAAALHVNTSGSVTAGYHNEILVADTSYSIGEYHGLTFRDDSNSTNYASVFGGASGSGVFDLGLSTQDNIRFFTGNNYGSATEYMRLSGTGGLSLGSSYVGTDAGAGNAIISGNVGIGTTTFSDKLHVQGDLRVTGGIKDSDGDIGTAGQVLTSTSTGTNWIDASGVSGGDATTLDGIDSGSFLRSDTSDNYTSGTLTFDTGTTLALASGSTLNVNGDLSIADTSLAFTGASTNFATTGNFSLNTDQFFLNHTSGYVGIGTTVPATALDVGGTVRSGSVQVADAWGNFTFNGYWDSTDSRWEYINDSFAAQIRKEDDVGGLVFEVAADGTTDGAITWVTGLKIDPTGNVGIGTETPGAYKLNVNGSLIATDYYSGDGTQGATSTVNGLVFKDGLYTSGSITGGTADAIAFSGITSGTNTQAAMVVGTGASLNYTGSGTINASSVGGYAATSLPYVNNATNTTLTRTGSGPYTLGLNLGNANTWTGAQTFNANTNFPGSGIWNTSGNVGIGSTSPASKLDVTSAALNSDVQRWMASDGSRLGRFTETSGGHGWFEVDNSSGTAVALLRADGGNSYISTGNFGLGTTVPSDTLHIAGSMRLTGAFKDVNNEAGTSGQILSSTGTGVDWIDAPSGDASTFDGLTSGQFLRSDTSDNYTSGTLTFDSATTLALASGSTLDINGDLSIADTSIALDGASTNFTATGNLSFNTNDLYIQQSTGNIGIGTTSPSNLLHIHNPATGLSNSAYAQFTNGDTGSTGSDGLFVGMHSNDYGYIVNAENSPLGLGANNLLTLQLDETGYVMVGASLPGFANGLGDLFVADQLEVDGTSSFAGNVGIGTTTFSDALHVQGDMRLTGAFKDSSNAAGSSGDLLTSTGTGTAWASSADYLSQWQRVSGTVIPKNITDDVNLGAVATSSALINLSGTTGYITGQRFIDTANAGYYLDPAAAGTSLSVAGSGYIAGNVGIGTTSTSYKLQINGSTNTTLMRITDGTRNLDAYIDSSNVARFGTSTSTAFALKTNDVSRLFLNTEGDMMLGSDFVSTASPNVPNGSFVIDNGALCVDDSGTNCDDYSKTAGTIAALGTGNNYLAGRLGIGTTSPAYKLHIVDTSASPQLVVHSAGDGVSYLKLLEDPSAAEGGAFFKYDGSPNRITIGGMSGGYEVPAINIGRDTGYVSIGTTTSNSLLTVGGHITPSADDSYDLGSSSYRWRDLYLGPDSLHIGSSGDEASISYNTANNYLALSGDASGTDLAITSAGYVGIGTTNPGQLLHVDNGATWTARFGQSAATHLDLSTNQIQALNNTSGSNLYLNYTNGGSIFAGGNVGIGTTSVPRKLSIYDSSAANTYPIRLTNNYGGQGYYDHVGIEFAARNGTVYAAMRAGDVTSSGYYHGEIVFSLYANGVYADRSRIDAGGAYSTISDARFKTNVAPIGDALEKVKQLQGVTYDWTAAMGGGYSSGFIAQQVEPIAPELVYTDANGFKSVNYSGFTPYLVEALKQQQLQIDQQSGQLTNLNANSVTTNTLTATATQTNSFTSALANITTLNVTNVKVGTIALRDYIINLINEVGVTASNIAGTLTADRVETAELVSPVVTTNEITANNGQDLLINTDATASVRVNSDLIANSIQTATVESELAQITNLEAETATVTGTLDARSARIDLLESRMAEFENIKAQTADLMTATVSGTLYANNIDGFQDKVASALTQPSLLEVLMQSTQSPTASSEASVAQLFNVVDSAGYTATGSGSLNKSLEDLNVTSEDVVIGASAAFINQYFEVNGTAYISDSLGIGNSLLIGEKTTLADGRLEYNAASPEDTLYIQPSGKGTLALMNNLLILTEDGNVTINGDVLVNGNVKVEDSLLTDLLKPTEFGNPLQIQLSGEVAGAATGSAEKKDSQLQIINELGTPVATISAEGRAEFAGGLGIGAQDLSGDNNTTLNANRTSGKAVVRANSVETTIQSDKITSNSLIYITPLGSTNNQVLYVKAQQTGSFTVGFDTALTTDVSFNWWIVN